MVEAPQRRIAVTEEDYPSEYQRERRDAAKHSLLNSDETTTLIINAKNGSRESAGELFQHYKKLVVAIGRERLGLGYENFSDYCQDCFIEMSVGIRKLRNVLSFGSWLARIARRVATKHLEDRVKARAVARDSEEGEDDPGVDIPADIGTQQSIDEQLIEEETEQETNRHIRESFTELQQFLELQKSRNDPKVIKLFELRYRYISEGKNPNDHKFKTIAMHELDVNDDEFRNVKDRLKGTIKQWGGYENLLKLLQANK